jgi:methyl coenzyme M reductase subunit C-like uncharacterized protein (methanogenesis marker protein 7)
MDQSLKVDVSFTDEPADDTLSIVQEVGAQNVKQVVQRGFTGIEIVIVGVFLARSLRLF